uniref:Uncharacterized protein n=1 Tax=viral metagenome TaxID=1070528 RepID=A0A6C0AFP6_9ZZZZ
MTEYSMIQAGPFPYVLETVQNYFGKNKIKCENSINYIEYMINDALVVTNQVYEYEDFLKHQRFKNIRDHYLKEFLYLININEPNKSSEYLFTYLFVILHLNDLLDKFHECLKLFPKDFDKNNFSDNDPKYDIDEIMKLKINEESFLGDDPKKLFQI